MRRIVNGRTYDTGASTLVAKSEYDDRDNLRYPGLEGELSLFQTPAGAYFLLDAFRFRRKDRQGGWEIVQSAEITPLDRERAQRWLLETEEVRPIAIGGDLALPPDERGEIGGSAVIVLRLSPLAKRNIELAARAAGLSVNAYGLRCAERYAQPIRTAAV